MVPPLAPTLVDTVEKLQLVEEFLSTSQQFGLDTETNVTDDFTQRKIRTIQVGTRDKQFVIDLLSFAGSEEALTASQGGYGAAADLLLGPVIKALRPSLENYDVVKVGVGLQFDYEVLCYNLGIRCTGLYDCLIAEKNIYAGVVHFLAKGIHFWGMEDMVSRYVGMTITKDEQKGFDLCTPLNDRQVTYCGLDTRLPLAIKAGQLRLLTKAKLEAAVRIDCDAISPFGDMHLHGLYPDPVKWQAILDVNLFRRRFLVMKMDEIFVPVVGKKYVTETEIAQLDAIEAEWRDCSQKTLEDRTRRALLRKSFVVLNRSIRERTKLASECEGEAAINYQGSAQLLAAFRKMGYGERKLPNTNEDTVAKLASFKNLTADKAFADTGNFNYPVFDLLLLFREVSKAISTYGTAWITTQDVGGHINSFTGRIHSNINLLGAATGRTSSSSPNVQNIPKGSDYRNAFVARPGYRILTIDYSGAELRILAFLSQEPVWLEAFAKGWDVHSVGAEMLFGQRWKDAAEEGCAYYARHQKCKCKEHKVLRDHIKAVNFGLAYGLQSKGLAAKLDITVEAAEKLLQLYYAAFPTVTAYLRKAGSEAKEKLAAWTLTGRRRRWKVPQWEDAKARAKKDLKKGEVLTTDKVRRRYVGMFSSIEREGKNSSIQGTNADFTKRSMFLIWRELFTRFKAFFINTVHDEIVIECPEENAEACYKFVADCMEAAGAEYITGLHMEVEGSGWTTTCWSK
jgi:DNA polymerase I-like protein with 3'-5' exonuclease and polymerase domains